MLKGPGAGPFAFAWCGLSGTVIQITILVGHSTEAVRHCVVASGRMDCIVQFELPEKLGSDFWCLMLRVLLGLTMRWWTATIEGCRLVRQIAI